MIINFIEGNFTLLALSVLADISTSSFRIGAVKILSFMACFLVLVLSMGIYIKLLYQAFIDKSFRGSYVYTFYRSYFIDLRERGKLYHLLGFFRKSIILLIILYIQTSRDAQIYTIIVLLILFQGYTIWQIPYFSIWYMVVKTCADLLLICILILVGVFGKQTEDMLRQRTFTFDQQSQMLNKGWLLLSLFTIYLALYIIIYVWRFKRCIFLLDEFDYEKYLAEQKELAKRASDEAE